MPFLWESMMKKPLLYPFFLRCAILFCVFSGAAFAASGDCSRLHQMPVDSSGYSDALAGCVMEMEGMVGVEEAAQSRGVASVPAARKAWDVCLVEMIDAFDDKISPASDIATALQDECQIEYGDMVRVSYASESMRTKAYRDRVKATKTRVTRLVLAMRSQKRKEDYPKW